MSNVLDVMGLVSVATLFGSMAFFSGVIAPLTFMKLDAATAGPFVRGIFPWYYLVIALLSLLAAASLVAVRPLEASVMGLIAFGAFVSRQVLMPRINNQRDGMLKGDAKAERSFARRHRGAPHLAQGLRDVPTKLKKCPATGLPINRGGD
jgi:hypothetical protein